MLARPLHWFELQKQIEETNRKRKQKGKQLLRKFSPNNLMQSRCCDQNPGQPGYVNSQTNRCCVGKSKATENKNGDENGEFNKVQTKQKPVILKADFSICWRKKWSRNGSNY